MNYMYISDIRIRICKYEEKFDMNKHEQDTHLN